MRKVCRYSSPLGEILLAGDDAGLTGLWFAGQARFPWELAQKEEARELPVFHRAQQWLDLYFSGAEPDFTPPLQLLGTPFQIQVWRILTTIPYGKTMTYGQIAAILTASGASPRMSAQAVGGAVGRNPISLIVPCHRVVGAGGRLTGYAGGLERKAALLTLEGRL